MQEYFLGPIKKINLEITDCAFITVTSNAFTSLFQISELKSSKDRLLPNEHKTLCRLTRLL